MGNLKRPYFLAPALLTMFVAFGCGDNRMDDMTSAPAPGTNDTLDREAADARITASVQGRFFTSDAVKTTNIDVDTEDGVVMLAGTVPSAEARQEAVKLAQGVAGVSRVEDKLTVAAPGATGSAAERASADAGDDADRSPAWITTKIQARYFVNPELKPWNIDVTTSTGGVVTLEGEIDSEADRAEAVRIARETEGVTDVRDALRLKAEATAASRPAGAAATDAASEAITDAWITVKIQSKYFLDPDVKGRNIDVTTNDGVVTLRGEVGTFGERRHAASLARGTDGVREVRDELRVDQTVARSDARPATEAIEDAAVTMKVQAKYFVDDQIRASAIDVTTDRGVVTLEGTVASADERKAAEALASDTEGVSRVVNRLKVDPAP
jgi:osmotically-inducible protein OsmY